MSYRASNGIRVLTILVAAAGIVALASVWHLLGRASVRSGSSYQLSEYFTSCVDPVFLLFYVALAFALGYGSRLPWAVGVGLILPLPVALVVEVSSDPTSHNLFPFEILFFWLPAFALAWFAALAGQRLRVRSGRSHTPLPDHPSASDAARNTTPSH